MKYFFAVALLVVGIEQSLQEDKCHANKLQDCIFTVTGYAKENEAAFPLNADEMKSQCSYLEEMRNCAYNYSRVCMTELERSLGELLFAGSVQSMKDICNPANELYQEYLKHADCIKEKYSGTIPCFKDAYAAIETLDSIKPGDRIQFLCCAVNRFRRCLGDHFGTACDKFVVEFIDKIIEFVGTELVLQVCISYEDYKGGCPALPKGDVIKGTYKENLLGELIAPFYRE